MGDTVTPAMLVSELATIGQELESAWGKEPRNAFLCRELAEELERKATTLKYLMMGFAAPTAAAAA